MALQKRFTNLKSSGIGEVDASILRAMQQPVQQYTGPTYEELIQKQIQESLANKPATTTTTTTPKLTGDAAKFANMKKQQDVKKGLVPSTNSMVQTATKALQSLNEPKYLTHRGYSLTTTIRSLGMQGSVWDTTIRLDGQGDILETKVHANWLTSQTQAKTWVNNKLAEVAAQEASRSVTQTAPTKLSSYERPSEIVEAYIRKDNQLMDQNGFLKKSESMAILKNDFGMSSTEADSYLSGAVVSAFAQQKIDYTAANNKLRNDFGFSDNDVHDVLGSELETIDKAYQFQEWLNKVQFDNFSPPLSLSEPKKIGLKIPKTDNFEYWDGKLESHDWIKNGYNGDAETFRHGPNDEFFPKIMVDSMGCYAMCMSHYRADYDNVDGGFNGWVPLRKNETMAAGTPMASVMQFFVKPVYTAIPYFHIEDPFYLNGERHPDWSKAVGMKLDPSDFFFLEPELAEENKIPILKDTGFFKDGHLVKGGFVNVNDDLTGDTLTPSLGRGPSINGYPTIETVDGYYGTGAMYGFEDIGMFHTKKARSGAKKWISDKGSQASKATTSAGRSASRAATGVVDTLKDTSVSDVKDTVVDTTTAIADETVDAYSKYLDFMSNPIPVYISKNDRYKVSDAKGKKSALRQMSAMPTFDRDFDISKKSFFGMNNQTDKSTYACKLQWYNGSGWSEFKEHPDMIPTTDASGKTMVIYRFPRQLDPNDDKHELQQIATGGGPDYSLSNTKHCYPYPREAKSGYALIGRLQPGLSTSDSYAAAKYEVNMPGNVIYGGRRKISLVPMVSPRSHPKAGYRTNINNNNDAISRLEEWIPGDLSRSQIKRAAGRFCFDSKAAGLGISVTDPVKYAYFNNPEINSTYFVKNDLKPGSSFFVIGQALTSYNSLDSQIRNGEVLASERISLSLNGRMKVEDLHRTSPPTRSHQHTPRSENDGSLAGTKKADFLVPTAVISTIDLASGQSVPGSLTIKDTFKRITGKDFDIDIFKELKIPGGNQNIENKAFYDVKHEGQTFSFPYSIAGFTIPPYWKGPTMEFDTEGNLVTGKEGSLKTGDHVHFNFYPPFGQILTKRVDIYEEIQTQEGGFDAEGNAIVGENVLDTLQDEFGDPTENVTIEILDEEVTQDVITSGQNTLLERYGNTKFVVDNSYEEFFVGGRNYMTGQQIVDAGGQIPVKLRGDQQIASLSGVSTMDFSRNPFFEIEDVTHKWGDHLGGQDRVVGDTRMQFVQGKRDVNAEILGFGALGAMDLIDNSQEVTMLSGSKPIKLPVFDCPPATQDLALNTKNRNASIKAPYIQYGPLNLSDEQYWIRAAKHWNTTPSVAKNSKCSNCVAFDISPRMLECMPGSVQRDGQLGYCWMHNFKCHSARTCYTWASGGPITDNEVSYDWQGRSGIGGITDGFPKAGGDLGEGVNNFVKAQSLETIAKATPLIVGGIAVVSLLAPVGIGWGVGTLAQKSMSGFGTMVSNAIGG